MRTTEQPHIWTVRTTRKEEPWILVATRTASADEACQVAKAFMATRDEWHGFGVTGADYNGVLAC